MPLPISERMSVSSKALFTADCPPRLLPPPPHGIDNDLVQLVGVIPHGAEQRVSDDFCRPGHDFGGLLLLLEAPPRFGQGVINGSEAAAVHGGLDRALH